MRSIESNTMMGPMLFIAFIVIGLLLVHYKPSGDLPGIDQVEGFTGQEGFAQAVNGTGLDPTGRFAGQEGFAVASVDPARMPSCVERSTDAQSLLARFATLPASDEAAAELRLLISKLCCMEADITAPSAGKYRTLPLQFRTSHDLEPPSTTVGRCLSQTLPQRDIDLALEKYESRGKTLLSSVLGTDCAEAQREFAAVLARLRQAFATCRRAQPSMDHPIGVRDMGFWESRNVANLSGYQGISASP
jgi:hypothetical protein